MRLLQDPVVKRPGDQMMGFLGTPLGNGYWSTDERKKA